MKSAPLRDADIARLQALLDALPAPLEPLDPVALDGYLCGVLLQPRPAPAAEAWFAGVLDVEGREPPPGLDSAELRRLAERRADEIDDAIARRDWFDPWIYALADEDGDEAPVSDCVLPWVAGFAAAMDRFPALMALESPELVEPLAILYAHFDPEDLEDADALLAVIEELEPPADLAEAVQHTARSVMLTPDVTRPRAAAPAAGAARGGGRPGSSRRPAGAAQRPGSSGKARR